MKMLVKSFLSLKMKIFFTFVFYIVDVRYVDATSSEKFTRTIQVRFPTFSKTFVVLSPVDCCRTCTETADCAAVNFRAADFTCEVVTETDMLTASVADPDWKVYTKEDSCQSGWTHFNSFCYYIQGDPLSWVDSANHCNQLYGKAWLLDVKSLAEQQFIESLVTSHVPTVSYVYIGGRNDGPADAWKWRNNDELDSGYTNWYPGQPETGNNENCAAMMPQYSYTWHDVTCTDLAESICKYRLA